MAEDLHTTPAVINYTVAIFIVSVAVAPIFWSPLAGFYGRKPVYLASMPIMVSRCGRGCVHAYIGGSGGGVCMDDCCAASRRMLPWSSRDVPPCSAIAEEWQSRHVAW